ncbi:hypothetical protein QEZ48_08405 [Aquamicrobium lusatiense]|uniref:hypothetical protein n=1 Tax=Aquamicrobium lusatiense TaxID=89772 RepID=UPI002455AB6E|nr:hypothetical protein [Aquamicrobium lusatiense]MDH4990851.1 hypothetical protein [Aquamicrobium lusatiense]
MTAINVFVKDNGIHFITDGITYMPSEKAAVGRLAKVLSLPWLGAAIATSGTAIAGYMIAAAIGDAAVETFDRLVERLPEILRKGTDELRRAESPLMDNCETVIGGWSESRGRYEAYAIATMSHNGQPPFTLRPVTRYLRPYPAAAISAQFDSDNGQRDGLTILKAQRDAPAEGIDGQRVTGAVGAFGQWSHLSRDGLTIRCIGTWPEDAAKIAA